MTRMRQQQVRPDITGQPLYAVGGEKVGIIRRISVLENSAARWIVVTTGWLRRCTVFVSLQDSHFHVDGAQVPHPEGTW